MSINDSGRLAETYRRAFLSSANQRPFLFKNEGFDGSTRVLSPGFIVGELSEGSDS